MKITSVLVLKCNLDESDPILLANATDVSHFACFQRSSVREFISSSLDQVGKRTLTANVSLYNTKHKTVLERGEKLDILAMKSSDLSAWIDLCKWIVA